MNLTEPQQLVLDMLMRAKAKGVMTISRLEILSNANIPAGVRAKLVWAALTMPREFVTWHGEHDFAITDRGEAAFKLHFNDEPASEVADSVIYLPGPDHYVN